MSDVIGATKEFRICVLALLVHSDWLLRYGSILLPEYFPSKDEQNFVTWVSDYYDAYSDVPTEVNLLDGLYENPLLEDVLTCSLDGLEYAADNALEFAKMQAMKLAILQSVDDIKDGDLQSPLQRVKEAQAVGLDQTGLGIDLIDDMELWMYEELKGRRFPTGWTSIDRVLGGGLVAGEYGLVMAPSGRGKTTALINIGYSMAGLMGAANVTHVTLEMPAMKIAKRYAARITGIRLKRGETESDAFADKMRKAAKARLRARLRIIDPSRSMQSIQYALENLVSDGHNTEALIIDYPDLIVPSGRYTEKRFALADITRDLRAMGKDMGVPIWAATQSGRHTFYKEVITEADVAEAIEKINISDFVVSVCQTRDEEKLGMGRLYVAKNRDGRRGLQVPIKIDFVNQSMIQVGKHARP